LLANDGPASPASVAWTCASCQVRRATSAIRPMPIESELMIGIAPRSCSRFSAAMPCCLIRLRAIAASLPSRACSLCTVIVIGTSSAIVAGVSGSVGVVEEPRICGWFRISSTSG
jgi:hypothetical protein